MNVFVTDGSGVDGGGQALAPSEIAANLVKLSLRCSAADLASFEKIVGELFAKDKIVRGSTVVNALWNMVRSVVHYLGR